MLFMGKSTISMAIFNSFLYVYQRFIDDFPIKTSIYKGFSMAMLNNQMVYHLYLKD